MSQEVICKKFINSCSADQWSWHGQSGEFRKHMEVTVKICNNPNSDGLILINHPRKLSPKNYVDRVNLLLTHSIKYCYMAVNRYDFVACNDLNIDWAEDLAVCVDQIISHIVLPMRRISASDWPVDGRHFVGVHGLDIYTYANNS